ncbi:hypothetical protein A6F55_24120 [Prescottella equi]|nr:hypothetical protein A6F55_24120 [Prescottella equi]
MAAHVGFVDAFGFVVLGGFFVASVDATTTQTGVAFSLSTPSVLGPLAAILGGFLAGVIAATLAGRHWPSRQVAGALAVTTTALAAGGLVGHFFDARVALGFTLAVAMGAANTLVDPAGLLVDLARDLSDRLHSSDRTRRWTRSLLLWTAVTLGAVVGAVVAHRCGTDTAWIAEGGALAVTLYTVGAARARS